MNQLQWNSLNDSERRHLTSYGIKTLLAFQEWWKYQKKYSITCPKCQEMINRVSGLKGDSHE